MHTVIVTASPPSPCATNTTFFERPHFFSWASFSDSFAAALAQLSLYTVGKAIGFVHANALRHPLGPGRPGTDKDGMIDSKT